jgi:hypothetical protein
MLARKWLGVAVVLMGCSDDAEVARTETDSGASDTGASDTGAVVDDTGTVDTAIPADAGTEKDCLATSGADAFFTLEDSTKCVVAKYDVATGSLGALTWGRHNGPLGFSGGATPALLRYEVPATATGALMVKKTDVTVPDVPMGAFWGGAAYDLPFFNSTAISYTGSGAGFPGELILVNAAGALTRYHANGFYSATAVGNGSGGRLIHTGVGPLSSMKTTENAGGLYAADTCGMGKLLPDGDASCTAPQKLATWEAGASGPVTSDPGENVFAILSKFGGKQELRGFEKSTIARSGKATDGTMIFSDDQYTSDLVADGKALYWQPNDAKTFSAVDVMTIGYSVDTAGKKITASGAPKTFLKMKTPGTSVALVRDNLARIWVGVSSPATGDAGPTSSVIFVLRAKTP